jgi:hypothetical protein
VTLPVLGNAQDARQVQERVNRLIREFNRPDAPPVLYAADTGSATAYAIAPVPGIRAYAIGQVFSFKAANANSGTTPTLNVNGLGAGTISLPSGAVVAGDISANGMTLVQVASTTPTFHLLNPQLSPVPSIPATNSGTTTFLGSDVALNNTGLFFNGPNTGSIGAAGQTWLIIAGGVIHSPSAATTGEFALYDGSSYIASMTGVGPNAQWPAIATIAIVVTLSGATTFTLRANANDTSAVLLTTGLSGAVTNKATYITAVRLT